MAGYYKRFIPKFSETAASLYELFKKKKLFEWSVSCEKAFTKKRKKMATRPVLSFVDFSIPLSCLWMLVRLVWVQYSNRKLRA